MCVVPVVALGGPFKQRATRREALLPPCWEQPFAKPSVPIFQSQVEGIPIGQKTNLPIRGLEKTTGKIYMGLNFIMPAFDLRRPVFLGQWQGAPSAIAQSSQSSSEVVFLFSFCEIRVQCSGLYIKKLL